MKEHPLKDRRILDELQFGLATTISVLLYLFYFIIFFFKLFDKTEVTTLFHFNLLFLFALFFYARLPGHCVRHSSRNERRCVNVNNEGKCIKFKWSIAMIRCIFLSYFYLSSIYIYIYIYIYIFLQDLMSVMVFHSALMTGFLTAVKIDSTKK